MASMLGVDEQAELPKFHSRTFVDRAKATPAPAAAEGMAKRPQGRAVRHLLYQFQSTAHR